MATFLIGGSRQEKKGDAESDGETDAKPASGKQEERTINIEAHVLCCANEDAAGDCDERRHLDDSLERNLVGRASIIHELSLVLNEQSGAA